jgi:hypothetical protein
MGKLAEVTPLIIKDAIMSGVPASLTLAQYFIESADGTSELATNAKNLFGIKWKQGATELPHYIKETKEWVNGGYITVRALFRKYESLAQSVRDHSLFLHKDRYAPVLLAKDYKEACYQIKECGYATSPTYTQTLINCIERQGFDKFDKEPYMRPLKVFLSPSSQEHNQYTGYAKTEEQACNLIADHVERLLKYAGVEVMRNSPAEGPAGHTTRSNAWGADYHIPIHTNAGGGQGTEVFCWDPADATSYGTRLAKEFYSRLSKLTPTIDRGLKMNRTFYEIKNTKAACAYIEVDFHDNKAGATWILSNIERIATEIAEGIMKVAGIVPAPVMLTKTVTASSLRVRQTPSLIGKIVGYVSRGTVVTVLETKGLWSRIPQGWVSSYYLA